MIYLYMMHTMNQWSINLKAYFNSKETMWKGKHWNTDNTIYMKRKGYLLPESKEIFRWKNTETWKMLAITDAFLNQKRLKVCQHTVITAPIGLSGLGVTCSPRDPRFVGSNPAEADGLFQDIKILSTCPPGGTLSWGSRVWDFRLVKEPQAWKIRPLSKI